ncbi:hypothetical protein QYE76_043634 [Lolium multiflorum]|uniref:CCHC-type domain-containing protein n=1 Tax=Lolium multiflorum TaxID=4521 RepID=A0AAD8WY32_LOLMU|nr:hypothetical protein QYE76_043634 [Lolium multiflorum]
MAAADLGAAEWERSKITNQDLNLLKKLGISKKPKAVCFPGKLPNPSNGVSESRKSAGSKRRMPLKPASAQSPPPAVSPKNKRKRNDAEDSGTSKAEEAVPSRQKAAYHPYLETLISSDDEEEVPTADVAARTSTSHTLVASETSVEGEETSPPQQNVGAATPPSSPLVPSPKRTRVETIPEPTLQSSSSSNPLLDDPTIKELLRIGAQFLRYRDYASKTEEKLAEVNERANTLAQKLEQSEEACKKSRMLLKLGKKATKLRLMLLVSKIFGNVHDAETSLSDHIAAQIAREEAITKRIRTQNRRFVNKTSQEFELEDPDNDPLLDAVSFLEFHGTEAREGIDEARAGLSRLFPYFFPKKEEPATFLGLAKCFNPPEDLGLKMRHENMKGKISLQQAQAAIAEKDSALQAAAATSRENSMLQLLIDASLDMAGAFLDAATEDERVEARSSVLLRLAHMASPINFNQFLEKEKLKSNGSNFTDWFRHVRIFLNGGNLQYVLDAPLEHEQGVSELFGMLKAAEIEIKKEHQVLMVNKTTVSKQGKSKGKFKKGGKKAATPPMKPKNGPKPDAECYYCKEKGHWKRNCSKYLADLKSGLVKKKKEEFLTKEVTGRKVELDEIEESLLVDQSSAVPENVPVPPTPATEEANDNDHETSNETATEPRRSTRDRATPDWYDPCLNVMIVDNNDEDPTYEEAMMSPDSNKWQEAMKSEMGSMYDNKVWTLVDLPDSRKAVENKWIFKRKTDADGNITVYKARLVAKGFRQIQGVDYDETFSPVAKLKSVRILLAIAAFFDYEIWQMDVKTAFLNGDIEEELYMVQPKGFVDPKNADKVCKLQRSIYGLKQASRSWNRRLIR